MNWADRAPEEYPWSLGLPQPEMLRTGFDPAPLVLQAEKAYRELGFVSLLAFWGVGWRQDIQMIDRLGMAHLCVMAAYCQRTLLKGVKLRLLIGDNHAMANEIPADVINSYAGAVEKLAAEFSIEAVRVSELYPYARESIGEVEWSKEEQEAFRGLRKKLERSAANLHHANPERRARNYFICRYREARKLVELHPHAILASADTPDRSRLSPALPTLWIYVLPGKEWRKRKPWFVDATAASLGAGDP